MVLLMMFTLGESASEIPAPSQPPTLSTMMLLVTVTRFHCPGSVGKLTIRAVDSIEGDARPSAALSSVPHDQVGVDDQARTDAVARRNTGSHTNCCGRCTILVE